VAAVAGIGGVVSAEDERAVREILARLPGVAENAVCHAVNDMKTALAGGTVLEPGIVCILGTGSVAYGRNADGQEHKTGGWGWKEGDPGSSFDLGISAIRVLVRAGDGRLAPSDFTRALMEWLGLEEVAGITTRLYQEDMSRTEIAALAPVVTAWADRADPHARAIVQRAVDETIEMIACVFNRLFAGGSDPVPLAIVGSLGNSSGWYRQRLLSGLAERLPRLAMATNGLEPVVGAALWAWRMKDGPVGC
jgi:N-acetylglucosamine kinase-like BadF-type ATPase